MNSVQVTCSAGIINNTHPVPGTITKLGAINNGTNTCQSTERKALLSI